MNEQQLRDLKTSSVSHISVIDLADTSDRTLLLGYDTMGHPFHVYLSAGVIHVSRGRHGEQLQFAGSFEVFELYPDDRVYPESTDFEFAKLIESRGGTPTYLRFDQERYEKVRDLRFHAAL